MNNEISNKFSLTSKPHINITITPATEELKDEFRRLRGPKQAGVRQFKLLADRKSHGEQSYMIMADGRPAVWFQVCRAKYDHDIAPGKRITLMNIEALPESPIKGKGSKIALEAVEKMAKEEGIDVIALDRPLQINRTKALLERHGYIMGFDEDSPKKRLNKLIVK